MSRPALLSLASLLVLISLLMSTISCHPKAKPGATSPAMQPGLGMQKRFGDEIMVAGQLYRIGTPVVLFTDPGGYDAYRVERRFVPFEESSWTATTQAMANGKVDWVSTNQTFAPTRFNLRHNRAATQKYAPEKLEQIRGGGWSLPQLQTVVDQFVIHYDVCPTSQICFKILHDLRGLSVHFMLDVDGTIYQTVDLKERTWHATISNDRSIGIEISNMGAYSVDQSIAPLERYYSKDSSGQTVMNLSAELRQYIRNRDGTFSPSRNDLVVGEVQGMKMRQYDFTPQQYEALIKLTAALSDIFPEIKLDYPRNPDGTVINKALTTEEWKNFKGVLGHYHVQDDKQDPGPAFQWDQVIDGAKEQLKANRAAQQR
jgi:N-acetylmuramoyl-L-alanine amidase